MLRAGWRLSFREGAWEEEAGLGGPGKCGETKGRSDRRAEKGCIRKRAGQGCKESGGPGFSSLSDGGSRTTK